MKKRLFIPNFIFATLLSFNAYSAGNFFIPNQNDDNAVTTDNDHPWLVFNKSINDGIIIEYAYAPADSATCTQIKATYIPNATTGKNYVTLARSCGVVKVVKKDSSGNITTTATFEHNKCWPWFDKTSTVQNAIILDDMNGSDKITCSSVQVGKSLE